MNRRTLHRFPSPRLDPWIFYSHGKRNRAHTFYSLSERKVHNKCIKEMLDNEIICSMHGWLVLSSKIDPRICQLFNPVSMATIQLPLLTTPIDYDYCALSCDPNNPNCIVMLIRSEIGRESCWFCRPCDVFWTEKDLELEKEKICSRHSRDFIRTVGCYMEHICIYTCFGKIFLIDVNPPYLTLTDLRVEEHIPYSPGHFGTFRHYLVESDGELFLIKRFDLRIDAYHFLVLKLDVSGTKKRLVIVDNLEGRSFFLSSFSSGISCADEKCGIKANSIYFTLPFNPYLYSFDMQKKFLTISLPCPYVKRNLVQAEWILPSSPNPPCRIKCMVDIISPLKINKSTMLQPSINTSIRKDGTRLPYDASNLVEKLSNKFVVSDWSKLPRDLLISIAEKLSCVSCARISTVCKNWESSITWAPKKLLCSPTFLHMPSSSIDVFHFINKSRYSLNVLENPEILNIQHAKYGWLLMTRYCRCDIFFLNPFTAEKIEIPYLPDGGIRGLCFSSFPTSSDCSVLGICKDLSHYFVYHIRRGEKYWTDVEIFESNVNDRELIPYNNPVFHHGVFYWIWSCGKLCAYDPRKEVVEFLVESRSPYKYVPISYLFENGEKLMLLLVGSQGKWFRVYELDEFSMTWKEVNTLDNKVIFLSRNSTIVTEIQGLEDKIVFNRFANENHPLMFSLRRGKLELYDGAYFVVRDFCDIPEYQIKSAWIMSNVKQHSDRELSW